MDNPQPSPKVKFIFTMDAVHRLNVGGVLLLFKKKKKKSILRYSRALGEIQVFEQSYIIKRVI
jgi:hypothetical protein